MVVFSPPDEMLSHLLPIVICLAVFAPIVVAIRRMQHIRAERAAALQGEHLIALSPKGIWHRTSRSDSMISWHAFKESTADPFGLSFFIETNRMIIHGIPRRVFAPPQDVETFLAWALH